MKTEELIVNPYSHITRLEHEGQVIGLDIEVPVPNQSKKVFRIPTESNEDLVDFILDLTKWGFSHFEADDLTDEERDLLVGNGFLVPKENAPDKPLFACFLDEVVLNDGFETPVLSDLIVDPSFRFESFDLTHVAHLIHDNNFSPHFPSIWIKLPVTEIEIGYWLRNEYIEIGQRLTAGEKISFEMDNKILAEFVQAGILINPDRVQEKVAGVEKVLQEVKEIFLREKYVVLEKILPGYYMTPMKSFFRQYVSHGFMPFNDKQVKRRYYQHNLPLAQFFHRNFTTLMSKIVGEEVQPSYVYAASYVEDAALDPHVDREQCEYSISFQVDYLPEPKNDRSPWGLYLSPLELAGEQLGNGYSWDDYPEDDPEARKCRKVNLRSGDGIIYKGRELVHYRYPLAKGHKSTSLFFHYVSKGFQGKLS